MVLYKWCHKWKMKHKHKWKHHFCSCPTTVVSMLRYVKWFFYNIVILHGLVLHNFPLLSKLSLFLISSHLVCVLLCSFASILNVPMWWKSSFKCFLYAYVAFLMCFKTNHVQMSTPLLRIVSLKLQCTKDSLKNTVWKIREMFCWETLGTRIHVNVTLTRIYRLFQAIAIMFMAKANAPCHTAKNCSVMVWGT